MQYPGPPLKAFGASQKLNTRLAPQDVGWLHLEVSSGDECGCSLPPAFGSEASRCAAELTDPRPWAKAAPRPRGRRRAAPSRAQGLRLRVGKVIRCALHSRSHVRVEQLLENLAARAGQ